MESNQNKDHLSGIYKDIAEILNYESAVVMHNNFKGQQVTFPTKLISKDYAVQKIMNDYDGKNIKALAKKFEYSERWVRKIVKRSMIKI